MKRRRTGDCEACGTFNDWGRRVRCRNCKTVNPKARPAPFRQPREPRPSKDRVYFIQARGGGPIKIGFSNETVRRINDLQGSNGSTLVLVGEIPGSRMEERALHSRFRDLRLHYEWFHPGEALVSYLSDLGFKAEASDSARCSGCALLDKLTPELEATRNAYFVAQEAIADAFAELARIRDTVKHLPSVEAQRLQAVVEKSLTTLDERRTFARTAMQVQPALDLATDSSGEIYI